MLELIEDVKGLIMSLQCIRAPKASCTVLTTPVQCSPDMQLCLKIHHNMPIDCCFKKGIWCS